MPVSAVAARTYVSILNAHTLTQSQLDTLYTGIKNAKITTVRIHIPWNVVQPTNLTTYAWTDVDRAINRALLKDLQIIAVASPPKPSWAPTNFDPAVFAAFAAAIANRYKVRGRGLTTANKLKSVTQLQLWDQPNAPTASTYLLPASYVRMLRLAYPAVKKANPAGVTVIAAALQACRTVVFGSGRAYDPVTYLKFMYLLGARAFFDAAAFNPLSVATPQNPIPPAPSGNTVKVSDSLRAIMIKAGDRVKKLHWSQVGYDTDLVTETQQADYLTTMRRFAELRKDHLAGMGIYTYQDQT